MCSFSCADEEQYETRAIATMDGDDAADDGEDDAADDGEEDEEENGRGRRRARLRGALARDAQHLTFGTTATLSDPASVRVSFAAVKTTFGASSGTGSGSTSVGDATTANARARIELECELDGQTYRMSTRTCRAVVKSFKETARSGHTEAFPRYLSVIFPHVTMNVYSAAESDASWDGLRALARALTDPALATTKTTTTTSENYDDGHDTDPDGNDRVQRAWGSRILFHVRSGTRSISRLSRSRTPTPLPRSVSPPTLSATPLGSSSPTAIRGERFRTTCSLTACATFSRTIHPRTPGALFQATSKSVDIQPGDANRRMRKQYAHANRQGRAPAWLSRGALRARTPSRALSSCRRSRARGAERSSRERSSVNVSIARARVADGRVVARARRRAKIDAHAFSPFARRSRVFRA